MNLSCHLPRPFLVAAVFCASVLTACKDQKPAAESPPAEPKTEPFKPGPDPGGKISVASLKPSKDPVQETIYQARLKSRQSYNNRDFDALEKQAAAIRAGSGTFGNGSWQITQFYDSFDCRDEEPESMWQLHEKIHQDWIAAKPGSVTALVAYADFLVDYAWRARGPGFAKSVTEEGWKLFGQRTLAGRRILQDASALPEKDPMWGIVALRVSMGQGAPRADYDAVVEQVKAYSPKFWAYDTARAFSLLPQWYGEPGDWEDYAEKVAARPDGLGAEVYARIVMRLFGYYDNVFKETKASWPKTKEGLEIMLKKYPGSAEIITLSAALATRAADRPFAKANFDRLGTTYLARIWDSPEEFAESHNWAEGDAK
jgi:hypothetical protein